MTKEESFRVDQYVKVLNNTFQGEKSMIAIAAATIYLLNLITDVYGYEKGLKWWDDHKRIWASSWRRTQ